MKVLTILGTRPEIIRLSTIIEKLDGACDHVLAHTGQNFTDTLSTVFFSELGVRAPDEHLGIRTSTAAEQVGQIIAKTDELMRRLRPDRLLILGDTNSGLAAFAAKRLRIPVFHMEAGNRCYDDRVPEEVNRRVIDHSSDVWLPYTQRSKDNLVREGIARDRIFVTGNPIFEVLERHAPRIDASDVLDRLRITKGGYFLVTLHRAENVDEPTRLAAFFDALIALGKLHDKPVVCSVHPRTRSKLEQFGMRLDAEPLRMLEPLGFFDFVHLEKHAFCTLSDSGTVQEECCILRVPSVTLRDVTERPETIECGSNVLAGSSAERIHALVEHVTSTPPSWQPPAEYLVRDVSEVIVRILLGHHQHL